MASFTIAKIATKCSSTLHIFGGVWSSENFPKCKTDCVEKQKTSSPNKKIKEPSLKISKLRKFQIINSSPSKKAASIGFYCVQSTMVIVLDFWFGIASAGLYAITTNSTADSKFYGKCGGFRTINLPMQNLHSNLCGLYCLYLVRYLVRKPFNVYKLQKNPSLLQTTEIDIVRFFNEHVK